MKKIIGYPLLVISLILILWNAFDTVIMFGNVYGFWIGLLAFFSAPIALLLRAVASIYFYNDWFELIFDLILVFLIFFSNHLLKTKYIIKKPKELNIDESNLPQITKYDSIKSFISIPIVYYGVLFGATLTLIIGVVLIFTIYYIEASSTGRIHTGILFAIGIGAAYGIFGSLYSIFKSFTRKPDYVIGFLLRDTESPIYKLAHEVANRVNAKFPDNILITYSPDFHVQQANSRLASGEHIKGNTLTIGFPFLKYLATSELKAVIGHEMAHFTGQDTVFSTIIAPAYRSLKLWISSITEITDDENGSNWAKLPNLIPLLIANSTFKWFVKNLSMVDRIREARADMVGSICYGTNVFSNALKKVKQIGHLFNEVSIRDQLEYAANNKSINNYYAYFDKNYMHDSRVKDYLDEIIKNDKITSEFDSHYSFDERISYLPENNSLDYSTKERLLDEKTMLLYSERLSKLYSTHVEKIIKIVNEPQTTNSTTETTQENNIDVDVPTCPICNRRFSSSIDVCRYCNVYLLKPAKEQTNVSKDANLDNEKFCSKCGKKITDVMKYCKSCGTKIK